MNIVCIYNIYIYTYIVFNVKCIIMDIAFKYLIIHMDPLDYMARDIGQKNFKDEMQLSGAKVF